MVNEIAPDYVVISAERYNFAMDNNYKPAKNPSKAKVKTFMDGANWISPWGESDNLWPKQVMDAVRSCAPAQVCIEILASLAYGNGPRVYKYNKDGSVVPVFKTDQMAWFRQVQISQYLQQAFTDYFMMADQFPQLIRNRNESQPGWGLISNISAPFCRLGAYEKSKGISSVYIHGSWENMPTKDEAEKVPLLTASNYEEVLAENTKEKRFMFHLGNYTPGNQFYNENAFHALVRNGTMDIFPEIPKIRKRRIKDAMIVKYHVQINETYWWIKYGGMEKGKSAWEDMSTELRQAARRALYTELDNKLTGSDNAFKSLFTTSYIEPRTGNVINLIEVKKVETEVGEKAAYDPDKMTAVADVFLAFGLPSSVANTVLSDNKSRGGGSDIREGNTSVITRMPIIRDNILFAVEFAMRNTVVNNTKLLGDDEFISMDNTILTTLDKSKNGTESTAPINTN